MKYKRHFILAIAMAFCMVATAGSSSASAMESMIRTTKQSAASDAAAQKSKDEVVYASLNASGGVDAIYAVNRFEVEKTGKVLDYGDYTSVVNLTNTGSIEQSGDEISFTADEGNFYYQGNMASTDLPWDIEVKYKLDGKEITPEQAAGAAGKLHISLKSTKNTKINSTFYDNYMLQITFTLDTDKCKNITAPDSTIANAGKNKAVSFTVLPGKDADFTIEGDVTDFEMAGISINAVPYSMSIDFPDMDDQFDDLEKLPEAISDLNDGVGEMDTGSNDMVKGANQLVSGSKSIRSGLSMLSGRSGQLLSGSAQIKSALSQISSSLADSGLESMDLSQVSALPDGLNQISAGLGELSGGLGQLQEGYTPAYSALDASINGIPAAGVSQEQIQAMYAALDPAYHDALGQLVGNYTAAQTVKGTYAQVKPAFDAVGQTTSSVSAGLDEMAAGLSSSATEISGSLSQLDGLSQLGELSSGLGQLSSNYGSFHSGLAGYLDGVGAMSSNYGSFHSGLASFSSGVGELSAGIEELHDGTNTLKDEVQDLPDMMQEEIDKIKEQYLPADFDTVSFTSGKNKNVEFVQFVMQGAAIEMEEPEPETPVEETKDETFIDRFLALFSSKKED